MDEAGSGRLEPLADSSRALAASEARDCLGWLRNKRRLKGSDVRLRIGSVSAPGSEAQASARANRNQLDVGSSDTTRRKSDGTQA